MNRPGFRQRPARRADPDPSRNLHVDAGRDVTVNDVAPYALPKHGPCGGKGMVGTKRDADGNAIAGRACACAMRRFLKAHPEIVIDKVGNAFWPADIVESPTDPEPEA